MRRLVAPFACAVMTLSAGGCLKPVLTANDVVVRPDGTVKLMAFIENATLPALRNSIRDQRIAFYNDGVLLGEARSGEEGRTTLDCRLPEGATRYAARAHFLLWPLVSEGRLFHWRADRTVLVVDIDDTICDTATSEVIFRKHDLESSPIRDSQPTMARLAKTFQIAYLTARPEALFNKTVGWLNDRRFPPGPVFVAPNLKGMIRQTKYKTGALRAMREEWPNIRIGIGESAVDARSYTENGMLAIIVAPKPEPEFGRGAVVLEDWSEVDDFFERNLDMLADPDRLGRTLENGGAFMVPYAPAGDRKRH